MAQISLPVSCLSRLQADNIYLWKLEETLENLSRLVPNLSCEEREIYARFKSERRKKEWLAVRALLSQVTEVPVHIEYEENGRPHLRPRLSEISISHTQGIVSIALSPSPIGIDVEQLGNRAYRLRDYFLEPDEFDFSSAVAVHPDLMGTWMWSAKESVYKLCSVPGLELKADIRLQPLNVREDFAEFVAHVRDSRNSRVRCFRLDGFVLTVATFLD